jgi:cholest-4-en-3-one 26-monooxygenase
VSDQTEIAAGKGDIEDALVLERKHWEHGPPLELFKRMRSECPVHWTSEVTELPQAKGFWSVTRADDVHTVSRDWETYSSERGGVVVIDEVFPIELARAMFIGMDPPKHDRLKALFQAGFTPKRIAAHEEAIREIVVGVLDRLEGRETCDLVTDVAQPAVSRVIGSFMGIPEGGRRGLGRPDEHGAGGQRSRLQPLRRRRRRDDPGGNPAGLRPLRRDDRRAPREPH